MHNIETNQSCPSEVRVDGAASGITYGVGEVETPILNEDSADTDSFTETATEDLSKLFESLKEKIEERNKQCNNSILKFTKRCGKFNESQQISAFNSFGSIFFGIAKGKIKVQPAAVSRRKSKVGSRQKQDTRKIHGLATRPVKTKRLHNISKAIISNQQSAKKAGQSMISVTTYPNKKATAIDKKLQPKK